MITHRNRRNNRIGDWVTAAVFVALLILPGCSQNETSPQGQAPGTVTVPSTGVPQLTAPKSLISQESVLKNTEYVVFAWNDLGMHCLNPTYDAAVLLPPYNTLWVQVVKRGNPPQIVTQGVSVEYSIVGNTYSYGKGSFGQFWDNSQKLFGVTLQKDKGLNLVDPGISNGLSGTMVAKGDHFEVDGIPLTPILDNGTWNPYQIADIKVKNSSGNLIASTYTTAPTSEEFDCSKCHGATNTFENILSTHDKNNGTSLVSQKPVLCASCHGSPALCIPDPGIGGFLSKAMHGKHATVSPQPNCYDCHPGSKTKCSRSFAHTTADGNCVACHGTLSNVSSSIVAGRMRWVEEPLCVQCHTGVAQVDTGSILYRNADSHGGMYCAACHSSPHATVPTTEVSDNYQALQYQGKAVTIGSCAACHDNSRGEDDEMEEYLEVHGGNNPEEFNACYICHTSVNTTDTSKWPHMFQWKPR